MILRKITKNLLYGLIVCIIVLPLRTAMGQEMVGVTMGNYNGLTGSVINPSIMTNSKNYLEVNFFTGHMFIMNTAAYIPASDFNIWGFLQKGFELPDYTERNDNYLLYQNTDLKLASIEYRIMGPSAMFQYGDHAFALTTGFRYMMSANRIPWEMPVIAYETVKNESLHNISFDDYKTDMSTQAWMEIGLSYAYDVYHFLNHQVSIGASVKYLWGYAGAYAEVNNVQYIVKWPHIMESF